MKSSRLWIAAVFVLAWSVAGFSQVEPNLEQGMKPYGSYHGGDIDTVSLANGNLTFKVDLMSYPQRGNELADPIVLTYESKSFAWKQKQCLPNKNPDIPRPPMPCPQVLVFGPPWMSSIQSLGNSVAIGFDNLPGIGAPSGGQGIYTGLSMNNNPIYVRTYSVAMPDGAQLPLVKTDSGWATIDGSGFHATDNAGAPEVLTDSHGLTSVLVASAVASDRNGNTFAFQTDLPALDTLGRPISDTPGPAPTDTPPPSTASLTTCPALNYPNQPVTSAYLWSLPTVSGQTTTLTLCYTTVYVNPGYGAIKNPASGGFNMLQSVVLPDQTYWAFQYDAAVPGNSSSIGFGDLLKIVFPTGGSISYTYTDISPCSGSFSSGMNQTFSRAVATRIVDANDGSGPHKWQYSIAGASSTTATLVQTNSVIAPDGSMTTHTFTGLGGKCSLYETQTQYLDSAGAVLKTVQTDYSYTTENPWDPNLIAGFTGSDSVTNVLPVRVTTILPGGKTSIVETDYDPGFTYHGPLDGIQSNFQDCPDPFHQQGDPPICPFQGGPPNPVTNYTASYGKPIAVRDYAYGQNGAGSLLRQTLTTYQWQVDSRYLAANLLNLPATVQVLDGAGNLCAETDYFYDETSDGQGHSLFIGTTGLPQHQAPAGAVRGNLTTVKRKLSTAPCQAGGTWTDVISHSAWFDTGELQSSIDPLGHVTTHQYDPAYAGAYSTQTCPPSTGGVTHCASGAYDFNSGLLTSLTDQNNQTSNFSYDNLWRMFQAQGPPDPANGNQQDTTTFLYPATPTFPETVTRQKTITQGLSDTATAYFDGIGRTFKSTHTLPNGIATVVTTFDKNGRVASVTNPYFTTSDPTYGSTQTTYDGLGRPTAITKQDGSVSSELQRQQ